MARYWALGLGILFGLLAGALTARSALRRQPVHNPAPLTLALHYIAAAAATGLPVTVIACAITGGFFFALTVGVGHLAVMWPSLVAFAALEHPAHQAALHTRQTRGWTEQDARTSGL